MRAKIAKEEREKGFDLRISMFKEEKSPRLLNKLRKRRPRNICKSVIATLATEREKKQGSQLTQRRLSHSSIEKMRER
jgi:hypothetical protein